jgi:hypothetical protein
MIAAQTAPLPGENPLLGFGIALALGALIGVERERKKRAGELGTGGLRTFALLAESGAITAWLSRLAGSPWIFAAGGALVTAILIAGYFMEVRARPESIGLTTEIAGLVAYLLGGAVLFGQAGPAAALAIATTALLTFKEPLHGLVDRIGREDLEAGLKLLLATFVVLPVLPDRPVDPWGVLNPYKMVAGDPDLGPVALGCVATRARLLGEARTGLPPGSAGGLVSSTAVTLGFARQPRSARTSRRRCWPRAAARVAVMFAHRRGRGPGVPAAPCRAGRADDRDGRDHSRRRARARPAPPEERRQPGAGGPAEEPLPADGLGPLRARPRGRAARGRARAPAHEPGRALPGGRARGPDRRGRDHALDGEAGRGRRAGRRRGRRDRDGGAEQHAHEVRARARARLEAPRRPVAIATFKSLASGALALFGYRDCSDLQRYLTMPSAFSPGVIRRDFVAQAYEVSSADRRLPVPRATVPRRTRS